MNILGAILLETELLEPKHVFFVASLKGSWGTGTILWMERITQAEMT